MNSESEIEVGANQAAIRRRRCYLIRHGHVNYFDPAGQPLDPRAVNLSLVGLQQVEGLAAALSDINFDRALSSDYPRARQTMELVLAGRNVSVEEFKDLREIRAGRLREIPSASLEEEVIYSYQRAAKPGASFLHGEEWQAFQRRILACFTTSLLADPDWDNALIVSHDAVNRVLLGWATGFGLSGIAAFEQDPGCLNVLDLDMQGNRVLKGIIRTMNFTPYDPVKNGIRQTVMENIFHAIG